MEISRVFKKHYRSVGTVVATFVLVALIATFAQPLKYGTQAKLLVVQSFGAEADPYAASRLNEYLSGLLVQVISSESFFNQTLDAGFSIERNYFSGTRQQQIKRWEKTIDARSSYDSGIIILTVYHPDKAQAENIANAAIYTLKTTNSFYHSIPNVSVRTIDSPSTSRWPVRPNVVLNAAAGLAFGLLASGLYIYSTENKKGLWG